MSVPSVTAAASRRDPATARVARPRAAAARPAGPGAATRPAAACA
jgi:hypothetical protein